MSDRINSVLDMIEAELAKVESPRLTYEAVLLELGLISQLVAISTSKQAFDKDLCKALFYHLSELYPADPEKQEGKEKYNAVVDEFKGRLNKKLCAPGDDAIDKILKHIRENSTEIAARTKTKYVSDNVWPEWWTDNDKGLFTVLGRAVGCKCLLAHSYMNIVDMLYKVLKVVE